MFNKSQKDHLAKLSFKVVEILLAGFVVAGLMNDKVLDKLGLVTAGFALMPVMIIIGLVLSADDNEPDEPDKPVKPP